MKNLKDKVAVVTGGASGIGKAVALNLATKGCKVALVDINEDALAAVLQELDQLCKGSTSFKVNVTDKKAMKALADDVIQHFGRVDLVFNNAGTTLEKTFDSHTLEDWEFAIGLNVWGVLYGCHFFIPHLLKQQESAVINTSSLAGFVGIPKQSSYCMTKAAVKGLSESLYAEYKHAGLTVTSVHPGAIKTAIFSKAIESSDDPEAARKLFAKVERFAMEPEKAAAKIVGAVEKKKQRIVIGIDAKAVELVKRIFPVLFHRIFEWGFRKQVVSKQNNE